MPPIPTHWQVLGKPTTVIFQEHLFGPAGMVDSFYDLSNRNDGVYRNHLPLPGWVQRP